MYILKCLQEKGRGQIVNNQPMRSQFDQGIETGVSGERGAIAYCIRGAQRNLSQLPASVERVEGVLEKPMCALDSMARHPPENASEIWCTQTFSQPPLI